MTVHEDDGECLFSYPVVAAELILITFSTGRVPPLLPRSSPQLLPPLIVLGKITHNCRHIIHSKIESVLLSLKFPTFKSCRSSAIFVRSVIANTTGLREQDDGGNDGIM